MARNTDSSVRERVISADGCFALQAQSIGYFEIEEQHANFRRRTNITHRMIAAVAVIAREHDCFRIDDADKPWRAAFVLALRPTLLVNGREPEHVARFNERLVLFFNCVGIHALKQLGHPGGIELFV